MSRMIDQDRARDSLEKINRIRNNQTRDEEWEDKYAGYVESLPATILNCGLGQAAATLLAAAKKGDNSLVDDPHSVLFKDLEMWLCGDSKGAIYKGGLMEAITKGDRQTYLHAQVEALKWLEWHKKLAVAYLKKEKKGDQS